jgi:glycosyltransferase involved in cell wall biosynthesis
MSEILLSVIIPAFNREATIADTLHSIERQTFRSFEVIVVDDGSTDGTCKIVEAFPGVRLLRQAANAGPGAARNAGAAVAKGRYLAFLDSDDLWFPWTLQNLISAIEESGARFVSGSGLEFRGSDYPAVADSVPILRVYRDYLSAGAAGAWLGTCGVAIERLAFKKVCGFSGRNVNAEDSDLWLRLGDISPFAVVDSPPSFAYRRSQESATGDLSKTVNGMSLLLDSEQNGCYPGGLERRAERDRIIGQHVRPVCVACLKCGSFKSAWKLYFQSLRINCRERRFRFLLGFHVLLVRNLYQLYQRRAFRV